MPERPLEMGELNEWFAGYCRGFACDGPGQRNYDLKELHTRNVQEAARLIAAGGEPRRAFLAEACAIFHDLGRFPQYRQYGTFKDSASVNHAHLSAQVLVASGLLERFPEDERDDLLTAVRLHNVFALPAGLSPRGADLLRLIRDADKLDIWRVFVEHYHTPPAEQASAATLGFPDLPGYSPKVIASLERGEMALLEEVTRINDFKLLQLSWVYDINFPATLALVRERRLLERLVETIPEDGRILALFEKIQRFLEERLASSVGT